MAGTNSGLDRMFFKFPFEPYHSQLLLMQQIYDICDRGKIGICESPTGTGKSLSIICAMMRWLEDLEKREASEYESIKQAVSKWQERMSQSGSSIPFDEYAKEHRRMREQTDKLVDLEKQLARRAAIELYRTATIESLAELELSKSPAHSNFESEVEDEQLEVMFGNPVTSDEQDEAQFTKLESASDEALEQSDRDDVKAHRVTVYYASRTHSQLAQFLSELQRTEYAKRANVVVLGSRQSLCVNETVRRLGQLSLINDACKELIDSKKPAATRRKAEPLPSESGSAKKHRSATSSVASDTTVDAAAFNSVAIRGSRAPSKSGCSFYKQSAIEKFARYALTHVTDIEDLCKMGRNTKIRACPYYASKLAARDAQLVLVPYAILFNSRMRNAFGLQLRDAVLVVDEAHNLLDALGALNSATVTYSQLAAVRDVLHVYTARYHKRIAPRNLVAIRQLSHISSQLINRLAAFNATKPAAASPQADESGECAESVNAFLFATKIDNLNIFELVRFCEQSHFWQKLFGFARSRFYREPAQSSGETQPPPSQSATTTVGKATNLTAFLQGLKTAPSKPASAKNKQKLVSTNPNLDAVSNSAGASSTDAPVELTMSCLLQFESLLRALTNADQDGRIILKRSLNQSALVKYVLLNPTGCLVEILRDTRAVVLCGGTMKPTGDLVHLLSASLSASKDATHATERDANANSCSSSVNVAGTKGPASITKKNWHIDERIIEFSCQHVIPADQLAIFTLSDCAFPSSTPVTYDFTFANRRDERMINNLGLLVEHVCATVPGGVVVFFQSYDYLDTVYAAWQAGGALRRIQTKKTLLREPKQSTEVEALLQRYTALVHSSRGGMTGAILLSVVGGKLSEGINFADDLGRCVIVVGLPYPNIRSAELREKVAYLNAHAEGNVGNEYCENVCMRAVNQSIGRAIRHRADYATILLVDQRFTRSSIRNKLPGWMQTSLQRHASHTRFNDQVLIEMRLFFDSMVRRFAQASGTGKTG